MKKLTAVEWLMEEYINGLSINLQIMKKALEMEKEQIIEACKVGFFEGREYIGNQNHKFSTPEEYYNETFKSE